MTPVRWNSKKLREKTQRELQSDDLDFTTSYGFSSEFGYSDPCDPYAENGEVARGCAVMDSFKDTHHTMEFQLTPTPSSSSRSLLPPLPDSQPATYLAQNVEV